MKETSKATNPEEHARECSYAPTWQCAPGCPVGGEATQTAEQVSAKLHSTMDARVWTEEFMKVLDDKGTIIASDAGFMIGWFANAIMCGYDIAHQRMAEKQREQAAPADSFVWVFIGESTGMPLEVQKCDHSPTTRPGVGSWKRFSESARPEGKPTS